MTKWIIRFRNRSWPDVHVEAEEWGCVEGWMHFYIADEATYSVMQYEILSVEKVKEES